MNFHSSHIGNFLTNKFSLILSTYIAFLEYFRNSKCSKKKRKRKKIQDIYFHKLET